MKGPRSLAAVIVSLSITATAIGPQESLQQSQQPLPKPTTQPPPKPAQKAPPKPPQTAVKAMTNVDVIKMVQEGVSEAIIIGLIRQASKTAFDSSPESLGALKRAAVSDAIQAVMFGIAVPTVTAPGPIATAPNVPKSAAGATMAEGRPPGIYMDVRTSSSSQLVQLEPTVISRVDTRGGWGWPIPTKRTVVAVLSGPKAALRTTVQQPTFYFYFDDHTRSFDGPSVFTGWLANASSPNEFVLVQLYQEPRRQPRQREMDVGKYGAFSSSSGVDPRNTVAFEFEKLGPRAYRMTLKEALGDGEFCLFYAAGASALFPGANVLGKVFDFGIDAPAKAPRP